MADGPPVTGPRATRQALSAVQEKRVVELACQLIDTASPTGNELDCALVLMEFFQRHGIASELQRFGDRRANVVARVGRADGGARLMLCGHLDTTGTGDPRLDYVGYGPVEAEDLPRARVADGVIAGLGAFNQKGGLAAAAETLVVLAESESSLAGEVVFAAVAGESGKAPVRGAQRDYLGAAFEGGGVGARFLLDHDPRRPDGVVITGPSGCQVVNAQTGYLMIKVTLLGRAVYHASKVPGFEAQTGIDLASRVVQALGRWEPSYREAHKVDCGSGVVYPNVTVGAIDGGWPFKPAQAPAACNVYIDLRVAPDQSAESALTELDTVIRSTVGADGTYALEVYQQSDPGCVTPLDHPLVDAALRAHAEVLGPQRGVETEQLAISNDGKVFAARGVPWVKCGPGGLARNAPRINVEQVAIRDVLDAVRIYVLLALEVVNTPAAAIRATAGWQNGSRGNTS